MAANTSKKKQTKAKNNRAKKPERIKPATLAHKDLKPKKNLPSKKVNAPVAKKRKLPWGVVFAAMSLATLVLTTIFWSFLGARSNLANSDQLVDSYMFENQATFEAAHFPATHTFFLKWPIFILGSLLGNHAWAITGLTIMLSLATVLSLAWLLWKIMRQPVMWGILILTIALALLLIPAQAAPGTLLPVNMAMLTTRNIEYIVCIAAFVLMTRIPQFKSTNFIGLVAVCGVLFLSDRLFMPMIFGSVIFIGVLGLLRHRPELVETARKGFLGAMGGFIVAAVMTVALGALTGIENGTTASPYQLAGAKGILLGAIYSVLGAFTNLGINPAPHSLVLREWPTAVADSFRGIAGVAHSAMLVCGTALVYVAIQSYRRHRRDIEKKPFGTAQQLSLLLIGASIVAVASFVLTDHYYAGDSRYLTILFFAACVSVATMLRKQQISKRWARDWTALLLVAIISALYVCYQGYADTRTLRGQLSARDEAIVRVLRQHPAAHLVGDYWRVMPIRLRTEGKQAVLPLENCTQVRTTLSSDAWMPRPHQSFAYLLTSEKGLSDFPACSAAAVMQRFGRPNSSVVIAGTLDTPTETLLFYDHGGHMPKNDPSAGSPLALQPELLENLLPVNCPEGTTVTIVAHPDDDILFTSPDLLHQVQRGRCMRTIYLTAGDSGGDTYYWLGRESGAQAAYDVMAHNKHAWVSRFVRLESGQSVSIASPVNKPRIALGFFNLPDGGMHGEGFPGSRHQSLHKLLAGSEAKITTVDGHSSYTGDQLTQALAAFLEVYSPDEVHLQTTVTNAYYADHSDHGAASAYGSAAVQLYQAKHPGLSLTVRSYVGYPVHGLPENVADGDLQIKQAAFLAYAAHDGAVCHSLELCYSSGVYGIYLSRQYTAEEYEQAVGGM